MRIYNHPFVKYVSIVPTYPQYLCSAYIFYVIASPVPILYYATVIADGISVDAGGRACMLCEFNVILALLCGHLCYFMYFFLFFILIFPGSSEVYRET